MATRRILFRFFDAGEDVETWGGGRLTLLAGGVLGSVGAAQGTAYARALGAAYLPEMDAGQGTGDVDVEASALSGETIGLAGAGSSQVLAGSAPLESGYLPFGASGWMYVPIADPGAIYTLVVKFADLPLTTPVWPVVAMIGDANATFPRNLVAYSQMQDAAIDRHRTLGVHPTTGAIEWGNSSASQAVGAQVHALAHDNTANTAHARVIQSSDQSVHWSIDAAAVADRTPTVIAIGELVNAAFVGQGFAVAQPKVVAVVLLRVVASDVDLQAYSSPACRNAYDEWNSDEVIGYWPMSQAVGSAVPNQVAGGPAGVLTSVTSSAFVRTVGDGVPYLPLASAGRAGGLVEADAGALLGEASASRGAGSVDVEAGAFAAGTSALAGSAAAVALAGTGSIGESNTASVSAEIAVSLGDAMASLTLVATGAVGVAIDGAAYIPIGSAASSWGAGSIGYAQGFGHAELAAQGWGAGLVELEAAGLIRFPASVGLTLDFEIAVALNFEFTVAAGDIEFSMVVGVDVDFGFTVAEDIEFDMEVAGDVDLDFDIMA